jgi:hypothetical protein
MSSQAFRPSGWHSLQGREIGPVTGTRSPDNCAWNPALRKQPEQIALNVTDVDPRPNLITRLHAAGSTDQPSADARPCRANPPGPRRPSGSPTPKNWMSSFTARRAPRRSSVVACSSTPRTAQSSARSRLLGRSHRPDVGERGQRHRAGDVAVCARRGWLRFASRSSGVSDW